MNFADYTDFFGCEKAQRELDADYADCAEFVFGWFGVLGKVFPQCEHLRKPGAFVHKAVKTVFLSSQPISYLGGGGRGVEFWFDGLENFGYCVL